MSATDSLLQDAPPCWCCGEPAPIRGQGDPWEGRLDGYCEACAINRCDAFGGCPKDKPQTVPVPQFRVWQTGPFGTIPGGRKLIAELPWDDATALVQELRKDASVHWAYVEASPVHG